MRPLERSALAAALFGGETVECFCEFLAALDNDEHRKRTKEVLQWVQETFPGLTPRVAWKQPMFTDHGTFIIGFSVAKGHLAVAPEQQAIRHFAAAIQRSGYHHTKELIRIPWTAAVDFRLLAEIIAFNIEDKASCRTFWRETHENAR